MRPTNTNPFYPSVNQISALSSTVFRFSVDVHVPTRKSIPVRKMSAGYLHRRLRVREFYVTRLTRLSHLICGFAVVGIVLMITANELQFTRRDESESVASWCLKLMITLSTAVLLLLIVYYHHLDIRMYAFRNQIDDWRMQIPAMRIVSIAVELLICAIHPFPRAYPHGTHSDAQSIDAKSLSHISLDVALGLPMFIRLYLFGRCLFLRSHLVRDILLRSFGYLNHVSMDFFFLMKTYLDQWPTRCLLSFATTAFFIGSWSLRACDYESNGEHLSFPNGMWLFVITFTTVGYGDLYPTTYCGRSIAALISLLGLIISALVIAIIAQKLLLSRGEKYVHMFVTNTKLAERRRYHAANVIKFAIKAWYLRRRDNGYRMVYYRTQRRLFESIRHLQAIRQDQRDLDDRRVDLLELMSDQRTTVTQTKDTAEQMHTVNDDIKQIKKELHDVNSRLQTLQKSLELLVENKRSTLPNE